MKTYPVTRQERQRGSALITFLGVILIVSLAAAALVGFARQQAYSVGRTKDYIKAQVIAEAGANEAYSLLKTNFAARTNPDLFPETSFGEGTYDATVTPVGDDAAVITCEATVGDATATAIMDVKNFGTTTSGTPPSTSPWAHSIFCNGYITHNGSGTTIGSVHVNNYLQCNGSLTWGTSEVDCNVTACSSSKGFKGNGTITIYGTVKAPVISVNGTDAIRTKVITAVDVIPFPEIDLAPYYQIAEANGQVFSSQSPNGTADWGAIPGGVKWINGTLTQNGSLSWQGCVIATGNIRFNGTISQTRIGDLPAIISRDGEIRVNGAHTVNGLVYSKGDLTWNGAGTINGAILVGGNLTFNGTYGNIAYVYSEPGTVDGTSGTSKDHVAVTAWQK